MKKSEVLAMQFIAGIFIGIAIVVGILLNIWLVLEISQKILGG